VTGRVFADPVRDKLRADFSAGPFRNAQRLIPWCAPMGDTAYTARQVGGRRGRFGKRWARDKDCFVVMTLAGALTVGKMGLIFCDLI